jgi:hypothetical protein
MTDNQKDKTTAKEQQELNTVYSVNFSKRELLLINNLLIAKEWKLGDALLIFPILDKIRPFLQPREVNTKGKEIITNHKN